MLFRVKGQPGKNTLLTVLVSVFVICHGPQASGSETFFVGLSGKIGQYYNFRDMVDHGSGGAIEVGVQFTPNWMVDIRAEKNWLQSTQSFKEKFELAYRVPEEDGFSRSCFNAGLTYVFIGKSIEPFLRGGFGISDYSYQHDHYYQEAPGIRINCTLGGGGRFLLSKNFGIKAAVELAVDIGAESAPYSFNGVLGVEFRTSLGN